MRATRRVIVLLLVAAAVLFAVRVAARPWVRAASLIVRSASLDKRHPTIAALQTSAVTERKETVPSRFGPLRAVVYTPTNGFDRAVLLTPGVNALGIEEPRLVKFARDIAASGFLVMTPELPDLSRYLVTARSTDMIEEAAVWFAQRDDLTRGKPFGVIGISFAGGLSAVAAGRPSLRGHVSFVFSFGGHANFQRVLHYLCTGDAGPTPLGFGSRATPAPHDYGVAIITLDGARFLVPQDQVEALRAGILRFLHASHLDLFDKGKAAQEFAEARAMESALPEPAREILHLVNTRQSAALGQRLMPHVLALGDEPALSPDESPAPDAPVFLLHGIEDNVVPSVESVRLAEHLVRHTRVRLLLTPLISHAEVDRPASTREIVEMISFWKDMFD